MAAVLTKPSDFWYWAAPLVLIIGTVLATVVIYHGVTTDPALTRSAAPASAVLDPASAAPRSGPPRSILSFVLGAMVCLIFMAVGLSVAIMTAIRLMAYNRYAERIKAQQALERLDLARTTGPDSPGPA